MFSHVFLNVFLGTSVLEPGGPPKVGGQVKASPDLLSDRHGLRHLGVRPDLGVNARATPYGAALYLTEDDCERAHRRSREWAA